LWEAASGKKLQTFQGHSSGVNGVALNGDGKRLWTASGDGSTRLWDPATGKKAWSHNFPKSQLFGSVTATQPLVGQTVVNGNVKGQAVFTHGTNFGVAQTNNRNLQRATDEIINASVFVVSSRSRIVSCNSTRPTLFEDCGSMSH